MTATATVSKLHGLLAFERRSLTEIATALSIAAIAGSTLYNLGFFAPVEWSLISLLNVQDLLAGASMALLPMSFAMWAAGLFAGFIGRAAQRPARTLAIAAPLLFGSGLAAWYFMYGQAPSMIAHLAFAYLATGAGAAILNSRMSWRLAAEAWLVFSLAYVPFSLGIGDSLSTLSAGTPNTEIVTDQGRFTGRILRTTSGYAMLFDGTAISIMPLSKISTIRRSFASTPEREYLAAYGANNSGLPQHVGEQGIGASPAQQ